jgi:hypothetical protein
MMKMKTLEHKLMSQLNQSLPMKLNLVIHQMSVTTIMWGVVLLKANHLLLGSEVF